MDSVAELAKPFVAFASTAPNDQRTRWREEDVATLEWLLGRTMSEEQLGTVAANLLMEFGGLSDCLSASYLRLSESGLDARAIAELQAAWKLVGYVLRGRFQDKDVLGSSDAVRKYLAATMASHPVETFRVLHLNANNRLIRDEMHQVGTVNRVDVGFRELAQRSLNLGSTGLIFVHNHPSGCADPSPQDIAMTLKFRDLLHPLGIALIDHLIVGRNHIASLGEMGFYTRV